MGGRPPRALRLKRYVVQLHNTWRMAGARAFAAAHTLCRGGASSVARGCDYSFMLPLRLGLPAIIVNNIGQIGREARFIFGKIHRSCCIHVRLGRLLRGEGLRDRLT